MAQAPPAEKVEPPTGEPPSEEPKQPIDTVVFGIAAALSLLVLAFTSQKSRAPKAEGIPYDKSTR